MAKQRHDFLRHPPTNECEERLRDKPYRRHSPDKSAGLTGMRELPTSLCLDNTHRPFTRGPTPFGRLPIGNLPPHKLRPTQWSRAFGTSGRVKLRELVFSHHSGPMTSLTSNLTMGGMGSCSLRDAKVSSMTSQSAKNKMETLESIRSNFCWLSIGEPSPRRQTAMSATVLSAH